jgi:uncharacterized membrane protein YhfC
MLFLQTSLMVTWYVDAERRKIYIPVVIILHTNANAVCDLNQVLKFSKSETRNDVNVELALQLQAYVISLYLCICGFIYLH